MIRRDIWNCRTNTGCLWQWTRTKNAVARPKNGARHLYHALHLLLPGHPRMEESPLKSEQTKRRLPGGLGQGGEGRKEA
jgi:hypothetical protein